MLIGHPHIKTTRVSEYVMNGRVRQKLIVETDLAMPGSGRIEENAALHDLHNYLESLALYDFADFEEVEIKTENAVIQPQRMRKRA